MNSFSSEYCQRSWRLTVQFAKAEVQPRPRCADTDASLKIMAVQKVSTTYYWILTGQNWHRVLQAAELVMSTGWELKHPSG